jgi:hypothetical protein
MMSGIQKVWTAGQNVTIDESMIRYMGRAISFVQYMPAKPIKHGIKVFCVCCAFTGVILAWKVYCGKDNDDSTALDICDQLVKSAGLTNARGRELYTDNWYTSVRLVKHMFERYGWTTCGTIKMTDKKAREREDIPFRKLSQGAKNSVERGWFREAVLKMKAGLKTYYIQCTTWKDKKQVCFLHSNAIGRSTTHTVRRHSRGQRERRVINAPNSQQRYADNFNAVDRNDRDSSDYSTTIRTTRYYLRIFCWALDRVIHTCYVVVCALAVAGIGNPEWKKYRSKHNGRHDFQIDLAMALLNYAISLDWDGKSARPGWMRQKDFLPCDCTKCYFCKNGHTSGACRKRDREYTVAFKCGKRQRTKKCTEERVTIASYSDYCRLCYKKKPKDMPATQKRKESKRSSKGCGSCQVLVCEECWP